MVLRHEWYFGICGIVVSINTLQSIARTVGQVLVYADGDMEKDADCYATDSELMKPFSS
jgi:hypothetical protein